MGTPVGAPMGGMGTGSATDPMAAVKKYWMIGLIGGILGAISAFLPWISVLIISFNALNIAQLGAQMSGVPIPVFVAYGGIIGMLTAIVGLVMMLMRKTPMMMIAMVMGVLTLLMPILF